MTHRSLTIARWLGHHDDLPGGLVVLHVAVGRDDVVQAEDAVDVGSIDAGLDLVDDPLQHGRARAALERCRCGRP